MASGKDGMDEANISSCGSSTIYLFNPCVYQDYDSKRCTFAYCDWDFPIAISAQVPVFWFLEDWNVCNNSKYTTSRWAHVHVNHICLIQILLHQQQIRYVQFDVFKD